MKASILRSLCWAVALTAAISASAAFSRGSRSLVSAAERVPGTQGRVGTYFWVDSREIVALPLSSGGSLRPLRIDSETGKVTPLPSIPSALVQSPLRGTWRLSPGGDRLLWAQQLGPEYRWVVYHLETGKAFPHESHPYDPVMRPAADWNRDGCSWVELRPMNGEYYCLENDPVSSEVPRARRVKGITEPLQILSVSPERRVTAMIRRPMAYWRGEMARINVNSGDIVRTTAPIPAAMGAMSASISPNERRMALLLWNRDASPGYRLLGPLLSELGIRDQRFGTLRVLDTRGRNLADLGSLNWISDRRRWRRAGAWQVKWTPDGEKISFVHQDQLYTIAAP